MLTPNALQSVLFVMLALVLAGLAFAGFWSLYRLRGEMAEREREHLVVFGRLQQAFNRQLSEVTQAQQKDLHLMQQRLLVRLARIYQATEKRFGEMQHHLTEDAGRLRVDLVARFDSLRGAVSEALAEGSLGQQQKLAEFREGVVAGIHQSREALERCQREGLQSQQEALAKGMVDVRAQVGDALSRYSNELGKRVEALTRTTETQLREISNQVDRRLSEGFDKTTQTFTQVLNHLSRIDEAQKRITELSSNVVSLQEVLADKRSRGAFGEVQLSALVRNLLPECSFSLQHGLSNGTRVDCILFLPEPTGDIAVDAKFPLESYRRMTDLDAADVDRERAVVAFRRDIQKHINDIADKYIIRGQTADGAMMFIPAEAVFAEIHGRFPELVEAAYRRRVWLVSPTTMMAVLTTARAVLKDAATREQVDIIQQHLHSLSKDFGLFQERMERLAKHIRQAHKDVDEVNTSARRISGRFEKIEQVELDAMPENSLPVFKQG